MRAVQPRTIGWEISSAWDRRSHVGAAAGIIVASVPLLAQASIAVREDRGVARFEGHRLASLLDTLPKRLPCGG